MPEPSSSEYERDRQLMLGLLSQIEGDTTPRASSRPEKPGVADASSGVDIDAQKPLQPRRQRGARPNSNFQAREERRRKGPDGVVSAVVPTTVASVPEISSETDLYAEIAPGQAWTKTDPNGTVVTLRVMSIASNGYVSLSREEVSLDGVRSSGAGARIDMRSVERLREFLKEERFTLVSSSERAVPEMPDTSSEQWTEDRLLDEVVDGEYITLIGPKGEQEKYQRVGMRFDLQDGEQGIGSPPFIIVEQLKSGWTFEKDSSNSEAPAFPVALQETAPAATKGNLSTYDSEHPEQFFLEPLSPNIALKYRFADVTGKEFFIARIGDDWYRMGFTGKIEGKKFRAAEMIGLAKDGGWVLLSETSFDVRAALTPESTEPGRLPLEAGRNPLEDIRAGDVWEQRDGDGKVISQIVIDEVSEIKGKKIVFFDAYIPVKKSDVELEEEAFREMIKTGGYICEYRRDIDLSRVADKFFLKLPAAGEEMRLINENGEIIVRGVASGKGVVVYEFIHQATGKKEGPLPYDQMMTYLGQGQFSLVKDEVSGKEKASPKNETDLPTEGNPFQYFSPDGKRWQVEHVTEGYKVTSVFTGEELGTFDEVMLRARMTAERWRLAKSMLEAGQIRDIETLDKAIATLKKTIETSRSDYVRVELEQAGAIKSIAKAFRQLAGKSDINPEVIELREAYQGELASIQNLEIQRLKLMGLEGKALREAVAGVVREYDFEEAERLYDLRRRFSPESKQVWNEKFKALWEVTRRNETYFDEHGGFKTREYHDGWKFFAGMLKISGEAVVRGVEKVGNVYNTVNKTKWGRRTMIATGVGLGGALAFSSGGAAVAFASLVTAKRMAAAAGLGVAADAYLEGRSRRKREEKAVNKAGEFLKNEDELLRKKEDEILNRSVAEELARGAFDDEKVVDQSIDAEEFYNRLQTWLKNETVDAVSKKQAELDRGALYRRSAAILAGFVAAAGIGKLKDFYEYGRDALPFFGGAAARAAEVAVSTPAESRSLPGAAVGVPAELSTQGTTTQVLGAASPSTKGMETILGERTVGRGETLWKYATEGGKTVGLDEKSQVRLAALLREKVNEKLATANAADIRAAGFALNADGAFSADTIQAGKALNLGKILSKDELSALIDQAKQPIPSGGNFDRSYVDLQDAARDVVREGGAIPTAELTPSGRAADIALKEGARAMREAGIEGAAPSPAPVLRAVTEAVVMNTPAVPERIAGLGKTISVVEYIRGLPQEEQGEIFRVMRRTVRDLFNTPETNIFGSNTAQYLFSDHPEFARVPAAKVLADHATLQNGNLFFYDRSVNPLHWTQMQEVAKFSESAMKTLGKGIATPLNNESIESYVLRIATAARGLGKSLPGFRMLN